MRNAGVRDGTRSPSRLVWRLLVLLVLAGARPGRASHLAGTEWQLTPVVANQYRVRLTVYLDPTNGGTEAIGDPDVTIAAFEQLGGAPGTDRRVRDYGLIRTGTRSLQGAGPGCSLINIAIQELTYEGVLTLEADLYSGANGYYLAWERCCRNQTIANVANSRSAPLATTLEFPSFRNPLLGGQPNAAPRFGPPPRAVALCLGEPARVSFAATDADGDSLAYALVPLLSGLTTTTRPFLPVPSPGPYRPLSYAPGFSVEQPLPGEFILDARTGELRGVPTQVGTYVVAVGVREYRRGELIGANRREIELSVANCLPNAGPTLTLVQPAPPALVLITGAADRCLIVRALDVDPGQTLTVRAVGGEPAVITPERFTIQFPAAPVDVTVCWTDCAQPGSRLLTLVVSDDGCRPSRPDTLRIPVQIAPAPNAPPVVTRAPAAPDTLVATAGEEFWFDALARDPDTDPLTLRLRAPNVPDLAPATVTGVGETQLRVRWTPPCAAARPAPYALWLRATDDGCATAPDSLLVLVRVRSPGPASAADLPNVITPNHDGRNECFGFGPDGRLAVGACAEGFQEVRIFNRWGRAVFTSTDPAFCWDAPAISAGTYFYLVRGTRRSIRGIVTVIR
ncbi:MAG: gliding motility-associated C-terminal domain-containing protein [Hymenobacteraceae bacterium]|nr:gliding motility-associated C-terminal domain-containing protein [Hymenobacteraceae bacterium]